jgi:hypothetical protein
MTATDARDSGISIVDGQLIVDGEAFLVLGGELHNSSAADLPVLDPKLSRLAAMGLNTVLAPVSWELVEPRPGEFDFSTVDALLFAARRHGLRLIPLWFGSWKNGVSSYRPEWMKHDTATYPLARDRDGAALPILSAFSDANLAADRRAFAAFLSHLAEADAGHRTVLMVQVENEVGVLGDSRDRGPEAEAEFARPVPRPFLEFLRAHRDHLRPQILTGLDRVDVPASASWPELFGDSPATDELFQALAYARYVDVVAAAGLEAYRVPVFVNAWLDAPAGEEGPGSYPSGGPLPQVFAAWRWGAPHLSLLCPDLYAADFGDRVDQYVRGNLPGLFLPEMHKTRTALAQAHIALGVGRAIGVSPFGVDGVWNPDADEDPEMLTAVYRQLAALAPVITAAQGRREIAGFHLTDAHPTVDVDIAGYRLHIRRDQERSDSSALPDGWGIVAADGAGGFVGTGAGFAVSFHREGRTVHVLRASIGRYESGRWIVRQRLNGDETMHGEELRFPALRPVAGVSFGETFPEGRATRVELYEFA